MLGCTGDRRNRGGWSCIRPRIGDGTRQAGNAEESKTGKAEADCPCRHGRKVVVAANLRQSRIELAVESVVFSSGLLSSGVCSNFAIEAFLHVVRTGRISWRGRIRWPVVPTAVAPATLIHTIVFAPTAVGGCDRRTQPQLRVPHPVAGALSTTVRSRQPNPRVVARRPRRPGAVLCEPPPARTAPAQSTAHCISVHTAV